MTSHRIISASAFLLTAFAVAGCSSGAQSPMGGVPSTVNSLQAGPLVPQDHQGCQTSDGIKVMPCRIAFDMNHPGPANVKVTSGGQNHQTIVEKDDCAARNVATITKTTMHAYSVAAGTASGSCTAHFTQKVHNNDGKGGGGGGGSDLVISNKV
jgi:hypothetical protein